MLNYILMKNKTLNLMFSLGVVSIALLSCASDEDVRASATAENETMTPQGEETLDYTSGDEGFTDAPAVPEDMVVTFEDDFTNDTGIPDPEKWTLCEKGDATWARYLSGSYDQVYTKDGSLYLIGEQVNGQYKTGAIETRGKYEFEHGVVQCRAKFNRMPMGSHTGIWMMPAPPAEQWPKSGEIDIMEHLNKEGIIYQTVHSWYADDMGHKDDPKSQHTVAIDKDDWNIYGVEWTADKIIYTVNGEKYLEYPNLHLEGQEGAYQWPFNHPFYLILSISLGGEGTWEGPITDSELPAEFQIDWIRVMQPAGVTNSVPKVTMD